ncbi:CgeB family protein [Rubellicoccus peritrichatus]|uniref:Glycosyltransferase n=1 Tax=Rubellicoccus peritrichatus TaxID=3080537 RepID=A0AAQ3LIT7_9BACT|nr:glycosyltransferase [Puniceicoccus sp. CR14]WOO42919.1 glycosyltransferase [Puniceicoccus sp. CR14]
MFSNLRILYVGPLFAGSTALHRMNALRDLDCFVSAIDTTLPFTRFGESGKINKCKRFFLSRTNNLLDWKCVHSRILNAARAEKWDILWIDKGQGLKPEILTDFRKLQPSAKLVNYSPDDMFNPANQTDRYLSALDIYDLFVTTKSYNIAEFREAGVQDVFFVGNAYEPSIHKPFRLLEEEREQWRSDVVFVGAVEADRLRSLEFLAQQKISLGLYGGGKAWQSLSELYANVRSNCEFIADQSYSKVLCASSIALGFLRKQNRDLQTTRSIEIPACGVFMLAERTDEHLALFDEGKEAEFFSSDEELWEKIRFYLKNVDKREAIARAGRRRCLQSGYSNAERLRLVLEYLV